MIALALGAFTCVCMVAHGLCVVDLRRSKVSDERRSSLTALVFARAQSAIAAGDLTALTELLAVGSTEIADELISDIESLR